MFPWFWWQSSPHYEFPLSGNVNQDFIMELFFGSIKSSAGDGHVEKKAFNTASYGRQLGLILEVLLHLSGSKIVSKDEANSSRKRLEKIYKDVDDIKQGISCEKNKGSN